MTVGARLLAKNSQAPRSFSKHAFSLTFFASKLAPTVGGVLLSFMRLPAIGRCLSTILETVIAHYVGNTQVVVSKNLPTTC